MSNKRRVGGGFKYEPSVKSERKNRSSKVFTSSSRNAPTRKSFEQFPVLGSPSTIHDNEDVILDIQSEGQGSHRAAQLQDPGYESGGYDEDKERERIEQERIAHEKQLHFTQKESEKSAPIEDKKPEKKILPPVKYDSVPLLKEIQNNVIGHLLPIDTPFGKRSVIYCDYTASGRCLTLVEDFIRNNAMPTYANTHSTTGFNALQTAKYREESRQIIKQCVNAGKDDVVIFTGSGATGAIHKIAWGLRMNQTRVANETVVFIGPYEHHSNILPWREYGVQIIRIQEDHKGLVDMDQLKSELRFWKDRKRHMIVSMSACSNVTGIIVDNEEIARIAHQYGAFAVFDFAAGGPYMEIDMNPPGKAYKDAVIVSTHKFVGGPGTPGVVIAKKWIFRNSIPHGVGGGTVSFVTRDVHTYLTNIEEREEGGTPAILESIRAGLVFKLKQDVGVDVIHSREQELRRRAFEVWEQNPNMVILGSREVDRVAIFSFVTLHKETGRLVHHNFISTLLSDLFGIQARGGCACAGPYAQDLLGISNVMSKKYSWFFSDKSRGQDPSHPGIVMEIMRPGFTRINLPYFYDNATIDYIIHAVDLVNKVGWKLLPKYECDISSASWRHTKFSNSKEKDLMTLDDFTWETNYAGYKKGKVTSPSFKPEKLLKEAKKILETTNATVESDSIDFSKYIRKYLPHDKRFLRYFITPLEASNIMSDTSYNSQDKRRYPLPFKLPISRESDNVDVDGSIDNSSPTPRYPDADYDNIMNKDAKTERNLRKRNAMYEE